MGLLNELRQLNRKYAYFATDNIDFLENTADDQNGTMLVINQKQDNDDAVTLVPLNEPLRIPDEIVHVDINTNFRNSPSVEAKPITVDKFEFHSYNPVVRKYETYDRAWLIASFAHRGRCPVTGNVNPEEQSAVLDEPEQYATQSSTKSVKTDIMPTWAATNSLLMQSQQQEDKPNRQSAIVAPLLRRSPTDYSVLYTVL